MRKIKNAAMRNEQINIPDVGLITGDARGVFIVPEAFAKRVLGTPGWHEADDEPDGAEVEKAQAAKAARDALALREAEEALAMKEAARLAEIEAAKVKASQATVVKADEKEAERLAAEGRALELQNAQPQSVVEPDEVGPDLESLDRDALIACAKKHDVKIDPRWGEKRLREVLDKALYADEGEAP